MRVLLLNLGYIHAKNLNGFRAMCDYVGATLVESSKLEEVADGTWDLVWIPAGYVAPGRFSHKTKRIILGPHNFVFPEPPWTVVAFKDPRASYNCLSRWNAEAYMKMGGVADLPLVCLPYPVDTVSFMPSLEKTHDCLVYIKLRNKENVMVALKQLEKLGLTYKTIRYGEYTEEDYKEALKTCTFGLWIGRHESQGFALQEALSSGMPLVVWDIESMGEEWDMHRETPVYRGAKADVRATTVPYWDARCGITVDRYTLTEGLRFMHKNWPVYQPREYVLQELSVPVCCEKWGIKRN
jgi:hypothetical protein